MQINLPLLRQYNKNFEKTPKWVEDYSDEYDETGAPKELGLENEKVYDSFRDDELYSLEKDKLDSGYKKYSYDDVETTAKQTPLHRPVNYDSRPYAFDKDLKYFMRTSKKPILEEKFLDLVLNNSQFSDAVSAINNECDFEDIIKIVEAATLEDKRGFIKFDKSILKDGCALLRKKYPIQTVMEYLNSAKFKNSYIGEYYEQGLLKFLVKHPEYSGEVLSKYDKNYKRYDVMAIYKVLELDSLCQDKSTVRKILDSCRTLDSYGGRFVNEELYNVATEFLTNNKNNWDDIYSKILENLKQFSGATRSEIVDAKQCQQIKKAIQNGISPEVILKIFF